MRKKKAVAVLLASVFSLALPLSSIAQQTEQAATTGPKVAQPAKSEQAIATKKTHKRTAKKRVKRAAHHKRTAKRTS